jgi:hypothetical protein
MRPLNPKAEEGTIQKGRRGSSPSRDEHIEHPFASGNRRAIQESEHESIHLIETYILSHTSSHRSPLSCSNPKENAFPIFHMAFLIFWIRKLRGVLERELVSEIATCPGIGTGPENGDFS